MTYIGIDVGSTYTKYFIFAANKIKIFTEYTPVRQHEYFEKKLCAFYNHYCDCKIVSCGYGKRNVKSVKSVTELTALATGLNAQCPQINIALDIGGQDTKIIRQQDGNLKDFFINDKCAAGSGLFLITLSSNKDKRNTQVFKRAWLLAFSNYLYYRRIPKYYVFTTVSTWVFLLFCFLFTLL